VSAITNVLDRAVDWLVTNVPGWAVLAIGLVFYPGLGLVAPLAFAWPMIWLIDANLLGVVLAGTVTVSWFVAQVEAARRRHLVEWTTDLRLLMPDEFEWLVGETFSREGWTVQQTGRQEAPDGNIDLKLARGGRHLIVQCKRWDSRLVKVDEIREFAGTLMREGLQGSDGVFVTLSDFTEAAAREAHQLGMATLNGRELFRRMEKVRKAEPCQICGQPMVLGRSTRGWWFRCVTSGCAGKRDLGNEPGRAVELLTR
jgi:HJR/Mrr/RecB family endonuclease